MASVQKVFKISTERKKDYEIISEEYNSAFDVAEDCNERQMTSTLFKDMRNADSWSWRGVNNYNHALELLRNGYVDKVEEIKKEIDKSVRGQGKRITFSNDIVGYAPIVPLAILGVPTSMINSTMKPIKTKVLNIFYNTSCYAYVDSDDIIKVGTEFLKVLASLEMQGYRVKLTAVQDYSGDSYSNILKINLKSANQPLDLKRMSFPSMHTGFFRVIGFDWYSKTPRGRYLSGYGKRIEDVFGKEFKDVKEKIFGENAICISAQEYVDMTDSKRIQDKIREAIQNECKSNNT